MRTKFDELVDVAAEAHRDQTRPLLRAQASAIVTQVLMALRRPDPVMLAAAEGKGDPASVLTAMIDAVIPQARKDDLEVCPVIQGTGFDYLRDGVVVGRVLECMGGESWSVTVVGKRWKLPVNHGANLIHPGGLVDCAYRPTREAAERLLVASLEANRKVLEWPQAA